MIPRAVRAGMFAAVVACCLPACDTARPAPQPEGPPPDATAVAQAQRARLAAMPTLALRGVAELRWTDESGDHVEDGDFELVLRAPLDTSLRVTKFGERVLWAGSGSGQWWLFEPRAQPSRVTVGSADAPGDAAGLLGLMRPAHLLATLGLRPVDAADVREVRWDPQLACWRAQVQQGDALMSIELRHASLLPVAVDWLDSRGHVRLRSEMSAFAWPGAEESVTRPGALVPTRIVVRVFDPPTEAERARGRSAPTAQATLALNASPPTDGAARIRERLFDFESLRSALKPEVVQHVGAATPPRGAPAQPPAGGTSP